MRAPDRIFTYTIDVHYSAEDKAYIATCTAFPGLSAHGETQGRALAEAYTALAGLIEVYAKKGKGLP